MPSPHPCPCAHRPASAAGHTHSPASSQLPAPMSKPTPTPHPCARQLHAQIHAHAPRSVHQCPPRQLPAHAQPSHVPTTPHPHQLTAHPHFHTHMFTRGTPTHVCSSPTSTPTRPHTCTGALPARAAHTCVQQLLATPALTPTPGPGRATSSHTGWQHHDEWLRDKPLLILTRSKLMKIQAF
ncbi:hypothetical protein FIBSPDRAFT_947791 [Athelia psychrophila]|uniref:Uncharacterized protein n=1 Tax=Athelia psychrophila TaxID=1759441 RepID=A0A166RF99_9AGAM|nr:hypothetical protein FIBSPDRAFT_947791 [Fibularhizoctonia sp. CBS 109695]